MSENRCALQHLQLASGHEQLPQDGKAPRHTALATTQTIAARQKRDDSGVLACRLPQCCGRRSAVAGNRRRMTARLPLDLRMSESGLPPIVAGEAETRLRREFSGTRILLVDDEPINREVANFMLEDVGLSVDTAVDGLDALEKAAAFPYPLILMDMQMPSSQTETLRHTRAGKITGLRECRPDTC